MTFGDPWVPSANFKIRKMYFGLMVLESILQVALLTEDSLLPSWLLTDGWAGWGISLPACPPIVVNAGSALTTFLSTLPYPEATNFIAAN